MRSDVPSALQNRSIVTHDLLCDAAEEALREGGLALCTIQEVARRAGRSAGSVYRRFGDKDRMIVSVMERHLTNGLAANKVNLQTLTSQCPHLASRLKALIDGIAAGMRRDGRLIQAFRDAAAASSNSALSMALVQIHNTTVDLIKQALRGCSAEITHPDKDGAIDVAVITLVGAIAIMVREPERAINGSMFQSELHKMLLSYLTPGDT